MGKKKPSFLGKTWFLQRESILLTAILRDKTVCVCLSRGVLRNKTDSYSALISALSCWNFIFVP